MYAIIKWLLSIILWIISKNSHATWRLIHVTEPATGVEPATYWLQISCAANCATPASGAGNGNRTRLFGLEGRRTSRCTTPAFKWFLSQPCINIISRFSRKIKFSWCLRTGSNCRPTGYEPAPLPTEVSRHRTNFSFLLYTVAEVCIFNGCRTSTDRWLIRATYSLVYVFTDGWPLHRVRRHLHQ